MNRYRQERLIPFLLILFFAASSLRAQGRKPEDDKTFDVQAERTTPTKYELEDPGDSTNKMSGKPEELGRENPQYHSQMELSDTERDAARRGR